MSLSNCQSYTSNTSDASSAVEASSECSTPSSLNGRKRRQFSIDRTKKRRLRNKDKWIDTRRKLLLNSGKQHQSRNGKLQPAKQLKPACGICKFNCSAKISHEDRKLIFDRFWNLCDHEKQWVFIEIVVKAENPYAIFYKYDLNDEEPKRIDLVRKVTTRSHRGFNDPKKCYDEPIIITSAKYKDLISLCQQNLIPPRYHNFYKNLKHSSYTDGNETE
ncbi:hypothetical protein SFRURICE_011693 [Spodoptera frugiperda]|nr:hypothetical protein SFRURICE_011693 [Spodoptera frugiperda]